MTRTIDADAHVLETPYTWSFVEERFRSHIPRVVRHDAGDALQGNAGNQLKEYWTVDNHLLPKDKNVGLNTTEAAREMRDIEGRLRHMKELDIDIQVLYPTIFLFPYTRSLATEKAMCRGYNRWLAEIWKKGGGRLRWVAMPSLRNLDGVEDELAWAKENGACGVYMCGFECDRRASDPYFDPFYRAAEKLDMPVCFHSGVASFGWQEMLIDECGFTKFKLSVVSAFHSLIYDRVPEKFPNLRWGFVEVSAQWIPYVLNDLDLRHKRRGSRMSSTIMQDYNMYVACQVTDDLDWVVKYSGEDNLVVGTDYGHHDTSTEIEALRMLKSDRKVPDHVIDKILGANAEALYHI